MAEIHPCTQYALDVVEGRRVAGRSEILACQRHLSDLARQGTPDFPWVFDEEKADRIFAWFRYCKHVEGRLVGQPIELEPFQKFDLGCIFGWVHKDTRLRRFEKAYIQEARKNGKSTEASGASLYLMCGDGEESPKVYTAAVDKNQARIVYTAAMRMAQKSPDIRKRLKIRDYLISHITRGGELKALSKDTHNKDGLNPSGAFIDEYHAHPTSEIYDLIWSAWGQRAQALMFIITTAGFGVEENPCHKEYEYCKQILKGLLYNERYFVVIRELDPGDNEHDPRNWIKANPLRAATPEGLAKIQEQHDEAYSSRDPIKIRNFRVKILNVWVAAAQNSYVDDEMLAIFKDLAISREEFAALTKGQECITAGDLSKKIDLTAESYIFDLPDGRVAITAHGFMPSAGVVRHEKTDKVPYPDWAEAGWITITEGEVTDYAAIETHIHDQELENGWVVKEFAFDPFNATHFANEMAEAGYTTVEIRQGMRTLSEPTKEFRELIISRKLVHDGSPVLTWCLANAMVVADKQENIMLSKKNASDTKRIDLLAAVITGLVRRPALHGEQTQDNSAKVLDPDWGM
jgi:phage terminase large subunit-like protein